MPTLQMRIGMHQGRNQIGGVIGTKKLRFDLWGADTLIANAVESNGKTGRIAMSRETAAATSVWIERGTCTALEATSQRRSQAQTRQTH